uniref:Uncharacterized protein n=1 Tax=Setaria italica TaxID=4555 RepID=K3ZBS3_SETIT
MPPLIHPEPGYLVLFFILSCLMAIAKDNKPSYLQIALNNYDLTICQYENSANR